MNTISNIKPTSIGHRIRIMIQVLAARAVQVLTPLLSLLIVPVVVTAQSGDLFMIAAAYGQPSAKVIGQQDTKRMPAPTWLSPAPPVQQMAGAERSEANLYVLSARFQVIEFSEVPSAAATQLADQLGGTYIGIKPGHASASGLIRLYQIEDFPTVLVVADNGRELTRLVGQVELPTLSWAVQTASKAGNSLPELEAGYKAGLLNATGLRNYLDLLDLAGRAAEPVALDYLMALGSKNWTNPEHFELIRERIFDWQSEPMLYLMHNEKLFKKTFGDQVVDEKISSVLVSTLLKATKAGQPGRSYNDLKLLMAKQPYSNIRQTLALAEMQHHKLLANWSAYAVAARTYFSRYESNDALELNEEARTVWRHMHKIEAASALDYAIKWAKKAVLINPEFAEAYETLAVLEAHDGDYDAAWEHATKAIALANLKNIKVNEAERLIEALKATTAQD